MASIRDFQMPWCTACTTAGIEVILDVVYNHTAEGSELGPTLSFQAVSTMPVLLPPELDDNPRYYVNDTGCGNTLNLDPSRACVQHGDGFSLRYWVEIMHVDGFRFDLATVLGRTKRYGFRSGHSGFSRCNPAGSGAQHQVKLIAEPWDVGPGGYQVGNFPPPLVRSGTTSYRDDGETVLARRRRR